MRADRPTKCNSRPENACESENTSNRTETARLCVCSLELLTTAMSASTCRVIALQAPSHKCMHSFRLAIIRCERSVLFIFSFFFTAEKSRRFASTRVARKNMQRPCVWMVAKMQYRSLPQRRMCSHIPYSTRNAHFGIAEKSEKSTNRRESNRKKPFK